MKPLVIIAVFLALLLGISLAFPGLLFNPGPLVKAHAGFEKQCLACHSPFRGALATQCASCHKPGEIGRVSVAGKPIASKQRSAISHRAFSASSCLECHTDHKGRNAATVLRAFRHDRLSPALRANCNACHSGDKPVDAIHKLTKGSCGECHDATQWKPARFDHALLDPKRTAQCLSCHKDDRPGDRLHANVGDNCKTCHSTTAWKPANFNHKTLAAGKGCIECHKTDRLGDRLHANVGGNCKTCHSTTAWKPANFNHKTLAAGKGCIECHKADRPGDRLHANVGGNCKTCHTTTAWKPASFNHDRYFWLDRDHRASCGTCHTDTANYKSYTCYGCHEHTPSNIAREHLEEGIRNYRNCVKCHRDGTDGD